MLYTCRVLTRLSHLAVRALCLALLLLGMASQLHARERAAPEWSGSDAPDFPADVTSTPSTADDLLAAYVDWDVDLDGDIDLVVTTDRLDMVVLVNDGHGQFRQQAVPAGFTAARNHSTARWSVVRASESWPDSMGDTAAGLLSARPVSRYDHRDDHALPRYLTGRPARFCAPVGLRAPPSLSLL